MESNNLMDKYAVAVKRSDESIVGHLPLGKSGKFAKTIFYFLKANKKHSCVEAAAEGVLWEKAFIETSKN